MTLTRLTAAELIVRKLIAEGVPYVLGIFGHGNVQLSQALAEHADEIRYIPVKNEQNAVHIATAFARLTGRPLAVTTSVGPGATNLVTGAAAAMVNRLPVLLLPGEVFAHGVGPVLQQVEGSVEVTANDALRPVSRFWARLNRPEQLRRRLNEAFEAMLTPGEEGPAVLCLPMDVQAEAADFDLDQVLAPRDPRYPRPCPDAHALADALQTLHTARRPVIVAGGGVLRSGAQESLAELAHTLGAPVLTTQAGMGALLWDHPFNLFGVGPCGSLCANRLAARADVVLGVGTRYSDFTTASETAFAADARFINLNIAAFDVGKQRAIKLWGDAEAGLSHLLGDLHLRDSMAEHRRAWREEVARLRAEWLAETDRWRALGGRPCPQSAAIAVINDFMRPESVVISAAGSLPGDMLRLWRCKDPTGKGYICEYGYSTMGFEVAAGLGAKLACPEREVVVCVGDLSFLMASQELVTAAQLGLAYTVVVFDNHGGQSIRGLQQRAGFKDFAMEIEIAVDYAKLGEGMACLGLAADDPETLRAALRQARAETRRPTVIHLSVDKELLMGGYEGWWDVPPLSVDREGKPTAAWETYLKARAKQTVR